MTREGTWTRLLEVVEVVALAGVLVVIVVRCWAMWLPSSFTLDETGAVWAATSPDPVGAASRFPQSVPYVVLLSFVAHVLGSSEVAMRAPSFLASSAALGLLVTGAWRRFGLRAALWTGCKWALNPEVLDTGKLVRPYGLAQLAAVLVTVLLLRALEKPDLARIAAFVAGGALVPWTHYFYGMLLPVAWAALIWARAGQMPVRARRALFGAPLVWVATSLPLLPSLFQAFRQRDVHALHQ